jgi:hypothetical protein
MYRELIGVKIVLPGSVNYYEEYDMLVARYELPETGDISVKKEKSIDSGLAGTSIDFLEKK